MEAEDSKDVPGGTKTYPDGALEVPRGTDWDDLRVFVIVAREGSLGRAARVLNVAKPTIRRRIENLETSLGAPLFDRRKTGVVLTAQGRHMADMAEEMAMMIGKAFNRSRLPGDAIEGECKLVMSDGLATTWFVPHFLSAFCKRHPRVVLRLAAAPDTDKIAVPPFDLQVRYAPAHDDDLYTVRVGTFHFTYFASRSYVDRYGLPRSRDDLSNHSLADVTTSFTSDGGLMSQYSNASALGRPKLFTNSGNIVYEAVRTGEVIGLLPTYTYLCDPDLFAVLPDYHFETGLFLFFSEAASGKAATRAMIDFLRGIVFDKREMPWFADTYVSPQPGWHTLFANLRKDAGAAATSLALEKPRR
ncbi:MAG: LysR family transcriptional regulator [Rhizomicrobium sp.]